MKRQRHDVSQRGAVAVLVALILVVLIGAAGIALDLGRLFVAKTELQNAADACALAAVRELRTPSTLAVLTRAESAGVTVGNRHQADFQDNPVRFVRDRDVTFSSTLNGSYATKAAAPSDVRFVRCTREVPGFVPWFMGLLGAGSKTVGATAVAWAQPGNPTCPIPLAMCSKATSPSPCVVSGVTPDPSTGLCIGQWYGGRFGAGGGINGNFNWVDFSGGGGGSDEVQAGLEDCVALDDPIAVGDLVDAKSGVLGASAGTSWNTRFGLYKGGAGNPGPESGAYSDTTGYAYTTTDWPLGHDAFNDYRSKQAANAPYGTSTAQGNVDTGLSVSNAYKTSTSSEHARGEPDRRLIAMPLVDCSTWGPGHKATVTGWACALMLTPYQGPNDEIVLEYRGVAGEPGVPCGTFGTPGGTGPLVPTLVQ
jgi:hypothetical protein